MGNLYILLIFLPRWFMHLSNLFCIIFFNISLICNIHNPTMSHTLWEKIKTHSLCVDSIGHMVPYQHKHIQHTARSGGHVSFHSTLLLWKKWVLDVRWRAVTSCFLEVEDQLLSPVCIFYLYPVQVEGSCACSMWSTYPFNAPEFVYCLHYTKLFAMLTGIIW